MRRLDPFQWVGIIVVVLLLAALLTGCGSGGYGGYYDPSPVIIHTHTYVHHYVTPHVHVHVYHSYGFRRR